MTIRSILMSMTVLTLGVGTPLTAQRAADARGPQPRDSQQSAVDAANRRRAAEQRQREAERLARLAAANSGPEWKFLRTVGARNGVSVLWDTRTNAILNIRNATNDQVEATFTVTAYDRAGGAWPRRTFKVLLAPRETKGGFSLSPGHGQRTAGAQVVVMPRILIRNLSREARDRATAEARDRATAEARLRSIDAARLAERSRVEQARRTRNDQRRSETMERVQRIHANNDRFQAEMKERLAELQRLIDKRN